MKEEKIKNQLLFFLVWTGLVILDQLTKFFANKLALGDSFPVVKNIFHITLVHNRGSAFGIDVPVIVPILLSVVAICVIAYYRKEIIKKKALAIFSALILGGALGNLIDRGMLGFVRDFIDFRIWPAFNFADAGLTIGVIGLMAYFLLKKK